MGGPMNWARLTGRNRIDVSAGPEANYAAKLSEYEAPQIARTYLAGEMHRMMWDQILDAERYAAIAGCTVEQARAILRAVFNQPEPQCDSCLALAAMASGHYGQRCSDHSVYGSGRRYAQGLEQMPVDEWRRQGLI